jgi:hypothetical protein
VKFSVLSKNGHSKEIVEGAFFANRPFMEHMSKKNMVQFAWKLCSTEIRIFKVLYFFLENTCMSSNCANVFLKVKSQNAQNHRFWTKKHVSLWGLFGSTSSIFSCHFLIFQGIPTYTGWTFSRKFGVLTENWQDVRIHSTISEEDISYLSGEIITIFLWNLHMHLACVSPTMPQLFNIWQKLIMTIGKVHDKNRNTTNKVHRRQRITRQCICYKPYIHMAEKCSKANIFHTNSHKWKAAFVHSTTSHECKK